MCSSDLLLPLSTPRAVARSGGSRCCGSGWWWWWWSPILPSPRPLVVLSPCPLVFLPLSCSPFPPREQLLMGVVWGAGGAGLVVILPLWSSSHRASSIIVVLPLSSLSRCRHYSVVVIVAIVPLSPLSPLSHCHCCPIVAVVPLLLLSHCCCPIVVVLSLLSHHRHLPSRRPIFLPLLPAARGGSCVL